jgi:hypothetical protein
MLSATMPMPFWVHSSRYTRRARLHTSDCIFCNGGTGMVRRPAVPGGEVFWSSYATLSSARTFMASLPYSDKADCMKCMDLLAGWVEY